MKRLLLALVLCASWGEAQTTVTVTGDGTATVVTAGVQGPAGANVPAGGVAGNVAVKAGAGIDWADITKPMVVGSAVSDGSAPLLRLGQSGSTATAIRGLQAQTDYSGDYASTGIDIVANATGANSQNHIVGLQNSVTVALDAGKTMLNAYGIHAQVTNSGPGALTNAYALYLPAPGGTVTNKYGVWSGGGTNVLTGATAVGGGNPAAGMTMQVRGTGNVVWGIASGTGGDTTAISNMQLDVGGAGVGNMYTFGSGWSPSGPYFASGVTIEASGAGGLTLASMQGNAPVRVWSKGVQSMTFNGLIATLEPITFASLGTPANGSVAYCSDCAEADPCVGSGAGALAKRLNGRWDCN